MQNERNVVFGSITFQIFQIRAVRNILHYYVCHNYLETRTEHFRPASEQINQSQGIFSSGKTDENFVSVVNQTIIPYCFSDFVFHFSKEHFFFREFCHKSIFCLIIFCLRPVQKPASERCRIFAGAKLLLSKRMSKTRLKNILF